MTPSLQAAVAFTDALSWGNTTHRHASGPTPWDVHMLYGPDVVWKDTPTPPIHWDSPIVKDEDLVKHLRALAKITVSPQNNTPVTRP